MTLLKCSFCPVCLCLATSQASGQSTPFPELTLSAPLLTSSPTSSLTLNPFTHTHRTTIGFFLICKKAPAAEAFVQATCRSPDIPTHPSGLRADVTRPHTGHLMTPTHRPGLWADIMPSRKPFLTCLHQGPFHVASPTWPLSVHGLVTCVSH